MKLDSPYGPLHALAAGAVLCLAISRNFWHNFLHGSSAGAPAPKLLVVMIACQIVLFGALLLFLWVSTLFRKKDGSQVEQAPTNRFHAVSVACSTFLPIALVAFGLEYGANFILEHVFDLHFAQQDLVAWFKPGTYSWKVRGVLIATALFEAPLLEEPLFRGVIFRGLLKRHPLWLALAAQGFLFALVHVNAASFLPLWYLGVAFGLLYWKTGSIWAPMTAHFLFNLLNLILVLTCGDWLP